MKKKQNNNKRNKKIAVKQKSLKIKKLKKENSAPAHPLLLWTFYLWILLLVHCIVASLTTGFWGVWRGVCGGGWGVKFIWSSRIHK